ncbi:uncharacterized protein LOC126335896 [Schistocerca gregaria]|uniref:uncharacterized protein LOC126335896 n=1 Tax=Schistocerca gregaria TaxID=7010 RepID=UPI00211DED29|nr:uncharacterized protein LOC126335896 [Schistocerca gregaria]
MAVTMPFGIFEFLRMLFGFCYVVQTFQHIMDKIKRHLDFCYVYIDDTLVMGATEVQFLVYTINIHAIQPPKDKWESTFKYFCPVTIKELHHFLDITNFYHRFI